MGEYIKYKRTSIKIGTCEDLFYASYSKYTNALQSGLVKKELGNDEPENYAKPDSGYRFRFPFPDEDNIPLGKLGDGNFDRGLLITIERGSYFPKDGFPPLCGEYEVKSVSQKGLVRKLIMENPNNILDLVDLEITQQKLVETENGVCLVLVYRCPYCGQSWRIEDKAMAEFIGEQIVENDMYQAENSVENDFWHQVVYRLLDGYKIISVDAR